MEQTTQLGMNRTGMQMSPIDADELIQGTEPVEDATLSPAAKIRSAYAENADALGSMPLPGTLTGAVKSGVDMLTGNRMQVLLDKLGERAAYERAGTRLYEAFLTKLSVMDDLSDPDMIETARTIHDQEAGHYALVRDCITELGGDPTAQTPSADLVGVQGMGLVQAMSDPRTNLPQCLNVLLSAELIDTAAWELLAELAGEMGHSELQGRFTRAAELEAQHLETVKTWCRTALLTDAGQTATTDRSHVH